MTTDPSSKPILHPPLFGVHVSAAGGPHNAILQARQLRCDCLAMFVKNQRQWSARTLDDEQVMLFKRAMNDGGELPVIAHASYLLNLATNDPVVRDRTVDALAEELTRCDQLGIGFLVVHPGAAGDSPRPDALGRIAQTLDEVHQRRRDGACMVLLETTAGQGTTLGRQFAEIADILAHVRSRDRVNVCLDTCHLFAAGYDIRTAKGYEATMTELDRTIGVPAVRCIHVNDSVKPLGSRVDRHAHIGQGCIGLGGFRNFVRDPRWSGIPMILETPKGEDDRGRDYDRLNLQRLRRMVTPAAAKRETGRTGRTALD